MKTRYSLLLAVAALLLFPAARAATITVCPAGPPTCDYSSIQAAINAASDGDVIAVGAGTYNESLRIDKELTIDGDSPGSVIINVSGENSAGIRTRANNVTLQDFTVTGAASSYSVKIEGINGVPATGIVIDNVVVQNSSKTGIDVNGVNGLTIEDVTVRNSQLGNGVTLTDVRNATLERITTENNTWGGVAMYTSGEFFPIGVSDITLIDINAQEVEEPSALPIYVDLLKPGSSAAAPALRIFLDPEEWPYHLHSDREALTVFDNHRRMNSRIWRGPREFECMNITAERVEPCTSAQANSTIAPGAPGAVAIAAVAPNPVQHAATVRFALPDVGSARLVLYDVLGREVAVLAEGEYEAGEHTAVLNAGHLASGLYVARLTSPYGTTVRRITIAQ